MGPQQVPARPDSGEHVLEETVDERLEHQKESDEKDRLESPFVADGQRDSQRVEGQEGSADPFRLQDRQLAGDDHQQESGHWAAAHE
jgi:hypothetical protein